jgi:CRP-like cAMP-binding protein
MESLELLKQSIKSRVNISDADVLRIYTKAQLRKIKKGQYIVHADAAIQKTNFIVKGAAIAYFIDANGSEHIIQFAFEGWWISDLYSYVKAEPAILNVVAIEDCEILQFNANDINELYDEIPALAKYFLTITQHGFLNFQLRVLQNLSLSAEQRYLEFVKTYPKIELRLAQKHIASYLGMSAEFLSKIKKRLS